jgi:hypothetical protein
VVPDSSRPGQVLFGIADWDRFDAFKDTSTWTASRRPLLVEITRGNGKQPPLHVRLTLGPADVTARGAIRDALMAEQVIGAGALSAVWSRLKTERLLTVATDDEFDLTATVNTIRQKVSSFLRVQLPLYDAAFREHLAGA